MTASVFDQIIDHAKANQVTDNIVDSVHQIGMPIPQGDVNFIPISTLPTGCTKLAEKVSQLAPGTTRGSRHCIHEQDLPKVNQYRLDNPTPLHGLVLEVIAPIRITHPEHKWRQLNPGLYGTTFQRAFAEELLRIAD